MSRKPIRFFTRNEEFFELSSFYPQGFEGDGVMLHATRCKFADPELKAILLGTECAGSKRIRPTTAIGGWAGTVAARTVSACF